MKKWYLSKTIILAVIQAIAGVVLVVHTQYPDMGGVLVVKSIIDVVIRLYTDQGIQ